MTNSCKNCGETIDKSATSFIDKQFCASCNREKRYIEQMALVDFSSLRTSDVSAYWLKRNSMGKLMTQLRCHKSVNFRRYSVDGTVFDGNEEYIDALFIEGFGERLIVISADDPETFPIDFVSPCDEFCTMTVFKREGHAYRLLTSKRETIGEINWSSDQVLLLWKTPYKLYAQTDLDKNYRKEWRGGYLEYQGNNYGDTSTFYIVGVLKKRALE